MKPHHIAMARHLVGDALDFGPNVRESVGGMANRFRPDRDIQPFPQQVVDAATSVFFERELLHMIPGMIEEEFGRMNARVIFPVYFANDPGAESIGYRTSTETGEAEIIADYAQNLPAAEVDAKEYVTRIVSLGSSAKWSIQEIRAAARANMPLAESRSRAARRAILRKENKIAFNGDSKYGIKGLFNYSEITRTTPATLVGGAGTVAGTAALTNLQVMHTFVNAMAAASEDVYAPDTLLLPPTQFDFLATQRVGTNNDTKVLQDFMGVSPHIRSVIRVAELAGAGTGGTDVAIAFRRDLSVLRLVVALDIEQLAPERKGLATQVAYHERFGGMMVHKPMAIRILEGI